LGGCSGNRCAILAELGYDRAAIQSSGPTGDLAPITGLRQLAQASPGHEIGGNVEDEQRIAVGPAVARGGKLGQCGCAARGRREAAGQVLHCLRAYRVPMTFRSCAVSMYCWKLLILLSLTFHTWQTWASSLLPVALWTPAYRHSTTIVSPAS
jgi:hypothetical protein